MAGARSFLLASMRGGKPGVRKSASRRDSTVQFCLYARFGREPTFAPQAKNGGFGSPSGCSKNPLRTQAVIDQRRPVGDIPPEPLFRLRELPVPTSLLPPDMWPFSIHAGFRVQGERRAPGRPRAGGLCKFQRRAKFPDGWCGFGRPRAQRGCQHDRIRVAFEEVAQHVPLHPFHALPERSDPAWLWVLLTAAQLNTCGMTAPSNFRRFLRIFVDSQEWTFHDARKSPFPRMATATGDRWVGSHPVDAHRPIRNLRRSSCPASARLLDNRGWRLRFADARRGRRRISGTLAGTGRAYRG